MLLNGYDFSQNRNDSIAKKFPHFVLNIGHFKLLTLMRRTVHHQNHNSYQLLYLKKGICHYTENGVEKQAPQGSFIIYRPDEDRLWTWHLEDQPDVYWVGFSGYDTPKLMRSLNLEDKRVYTLPESNIYEPLFQSIIDEFKHRQPHYIEICALHLQELLIKLSREYELSKNQHEPMPPEVLNSIRYIEEHYHEELYLDELAKMNYISKSWLIRQFNKHLKTSPIKYLNSLRIEKAKLLLQEDYSIGEVSRSVGFADQLYFCKMFKQSCGCSPGSFRSKLKNKG